ncbi:acetyltransferase family protein [Collimonas arenae]|uniref:Acetyltransferase family protein n=1 Tax=Collimonas arenae TaxID=279058 RepID=A0A127QMY4_9BURK|nr:acetyltransferase family protein [Collimonas arenae]
MENGFSQDDYERLLIIGENNVVVGEIVHFKIRTPYTREIGYWLFDENFRGRGYVSEAVQLLADHLFRSRPINRIEIIASSENDGSKRVAEKAGFRFEGVLRQYVFMGGKYHDSCVYSLLRDEWGGKKVDSENSLAS